MRDEEWIVKKAVHNTLHEAVEEGKADPSSYRTVTPKFSAEEAYRRFNASANKSASRQNDAARDLVMTWLKRFEEEDAHKFTPRQLARQGWSLYCSGVSPLVKNREMIFMPDLEDPEIFKPEELDFKADNSARFMKTRLFLESLWRQRCPTDARLHIGYKAAMDTLNYQLVPAAVSLNRLRQRILIADGVGLGKTLEAGILISELIARGKGRRILVVTVKSMMLQFQKELWNRFAIPLVRLDSQKIRRIRAELPQNCNPFYYYDKSIISIDTLKNDGEYRTNLENARWDIIVIDEAHNVADRGRNGNRSQRARLAELLAERSDNLIMLSATPHDGRAESFASLISMLDKAAIADKRNYSSKDTEGLCVRRFKKDLSGTSGAFQDRRVFIEHSPASEAEETAFSIFAGMELNMDKERSRVSAGLLFKTTLEKALFSSPAACMASIKERVRRLEKKAASVRDASAREALASDTAKLQELGRAVGKVDSRNFSRYCGLLELLKSKEYGWTRAAGDRIVIFTERIDTKNFLVSALEADLKLGRGAVACMDGSMQDSELQKIVEDFGREQAPIRILVASDVAAEGINLHYLSHRLIHFDIPWSLMTFQQRNGRIDRYGQTCTPDIRYFITQSRCAKIRGDVRITEVLVEKERQAYRNIGDPAILMRKFSVDEEEKVTAEAIERGLSGDEFSSQLEESLNEASALDSFLSMFDDVPPALENDESGSSAADDADPADVVPPLNPAAAVRPELAGDPTIFSDAEYVKNAFNFFPEDGRSEPVYCKDLPGGSGFELLPSEELRRSLSSVLPEDIDLSRSLVLSPDRGFCMQAVRSSLSSGLSGGAWPAVQYLWALNPVVSFVNDKASLLFARGEAPLACVNTLPAGQTLFFMVGSVPNRRAEPVVDERFGLLFDGSRFIKSVSMEEAVRLCGFASARVVNPGLAGSGEELSAKALLPAVIEQGRLYMQARSEEYKRRVSGQLKGEIARLSGLEERHRQTAGDSTAVKRLKEERLCKVETEFKELTKFVNDSLTIEETPYLRVAGAAMGI